MNHNILFLVPTCELVKFNKKSVVVRCIKSIKKFYPLNKIIIINDSPINVVSNKQIKTYFNNSTIDVVSPLTKGSACSFAMNYLYHTNYEYGIVIHDSTELINHLPDLNFDIKFFWSFTEHFFWDGRRVPVAHKTKTIKTHKDEIFNLYINLESSIFKNNFIDFFSKKKLWRGCMGNMMIISNKFLHHVENITKILSLTNFVVTRRDRMCMESIFAMAVFYSKQFDLNSEFTYSLQGNWNKYNDPSYINYLGKNVIYIKKYHLKR